MNLKNTDRPNAVVVGDFHTSLSPINRTHEQKINKATLELNDTIELMYLTDIYRVFHPATAQCAFFWQPM
jgi:hypothetical protein